MASLFSVFSAPSRKGDAWFCVGLVSSFPDITNSNNASLSEQRSCTGQDSVPGCKVFHVPATDSSQAHQIEGDSMFHEEGDLRDQVLVFKYNGKLHAVNNRCPHSSYPLSEGIPFDIEDFGITLSVGITCPKHGWSFDLFTGKADRANYKLGIWEVQLRPDPDTRAGVGNEKGDDQEVWVRRKQRMG
ncbi:uncharacterized protein GGS22DRAFT_168611 [Annulohypoxylon maeteangense]|uniref:uncharacterized protein n=1 Tax=Annulohypoxylon maeteangense TaxID=1927788 RepID=UPI002007B598|nr:uncharacterized protein GGS22DRAFT_168611 [Annulohypoxylon maeteangense]KAI0882740.1 hypothetical protein GGS22DRAFT_168611 [Annulohypoxylon maeteangense]